MLYFFRKFQKSIFIFVTIVIVTSFVFFGTYQAFAPSRFLSNEVAFKTFEGKKVKQSYVAAFSRFLSSEPSPSLIIPGKNWVNFLNDGVVSKDFFETNIGYLLVQQREEVFLEEYRTKLAREKSYKPYTHPIARSLSADSVWSLFAPEINDQLKILQTCENPLDQKAFYARAKLYLAERQFPPSLLAQVLRYQEKEYPKIAFDPRLFREEVSLFGYKNLYDWVGANYLDWVSEFIIRGACYARTQGYRVTKEEVLADLLSRCQHTYEMIKSYPACSVMNGYELFQECLKFLQIDEQQAVQIWQDILLFRRLFQEAGNLLIMDPLPFKKFYAYAKESFEVELYQLPEELQLKTFEDLKAFEIYLNKVSPPRQNPLSLPEAFDALEIIEKRAPELIGKRYHLKFAHLTKKQLSSKIPLKQIWDWEVSEENWEKIRKQFPEIGKASDSQIRYQILENLPKKRREGIDHFAAFQIIECAPDLIKECLEKIPLQEKDIFLRGIQKECIFKGIGDIASLKAHLDYEDEVSNYSQDQENFYRLVIERRAEEKELMPFSQVKKEGLYKDTEWDGTVLLKTIYEDSMRYGLVSTSLSDDELKEKMIPYRFVYPLRHMGDELLWKLVKKEKTLSRSQSSPVSFEDMIKFSDGSFSTVCVSPEIGAFFFRILDKKSIQDLPFAKIKEAQDILALEAKYHLAVELLKNCF